MHNISIYYYSIKNYVLLHEKSKKYSPPFKEYYKSLERLEVPTKELESYQRVKTIIKRYNHE